VDEGDKELHLPGQEVFPGFHQVVLVLVNSEGNEQKTGLIHMLPVLIHNSNGNFIGFDFMTQTVAQSVGHHSPRRARSENDDIAHKDSLPGMHMRCVCNKLKDIANSLAQSLRTPTKYMIFFNNVSKFIVISSSFWFAFNSWQPTQQRPYVKS
jgi:hypothetical protein